MPKFSIVIPTRDRPQTLPYAIQSVLFQDYQDYELVVQDNCSGPETAAVVRQFHSPRLKYNRAGRPLPMNENWEAALALCEGQYVYFMGDDDGLMPDGLPLADQILARVPTEVLSWRKFTYWWDNAIEPTLCGRMFLHLTTEFQMIDCQRLLKAYYDWEIGFGALPSIYNALVHRSVIERVRVRAGSYFAVGAPDNFTGIANAAVCPQVGWFERGLSMCGNSGYSTGCSYFFRSRGQERRRLYHADEGKTIDQIIHPALIPSVNIEVGQGDMQLRAKELLFPGDDRYQVQIPRVLAGMAANINRDPDSYDEVVDEIHQLAAKHAIDPASIAIPQRLEGGRALMQGPLAGTGRQIDTLAVNCSQAGVHDVAQAARLATAVLPVLTIQ